MPQTHDGLDTQSAQPSGVIDVLPKGAVVVFPRAGFDPGPFDSEAVVTDAEVL